MNRPPTPKHPLSPDYVYGAECSDCGRYYVYAWWHALTQRHPPRRRAR